MDDLPAGDRLRRGNQRDKPRLPGFIRRHVTDTGDAEDILQDVFYELLQAYRMMKPIEHVTGWLFRVARNRIVDLFRSKRPGSLSGPIEPRRKEPNCCSKTSCHQPMTAEAAYAHVLLETLEDALEELPEEQREVFVAHGSRAQASANSLTETGISLNTLLSAQTMRRAPPARRLQAIYNDFAGR